MATNSFRIPKKQWERWSDLAQRTFNQVFKAMKENQGIYLHPKAQPAAKGHWRTTCWNAAWTAANAVMGGLKDITEGRS